MENICTFAKQNQIMEALTPLALLKKERDEIKQKLSTVVVPEGEAVYIYWEVGRALNISGPTVKNYLDGKISDGLLANAIYKEFKRLKMVK